MHSKVLISSDHHANWESLEHWFEYAKKNKLPFIIVGDIIGDYDFEQIVQGFGIVMPQSYDSSHQTSELKDVYKSMVKFHAAKLASMIDKYKVHTYYLLGNHDPVFFVDLVSRHLENKKLITDIITYKGVLDINGFTVAGICNTNHMQSYLYQILSAVELDKIFPHMRQLRPVTINFTKDNIMLMDDPVTDPDWIRIVDDKIPQLDIFLTHGQIGRGSWSKDKHADEVPTLVSAAKLSLNAKLTIDGHLHTTHTMKNAVGKPSLRAVGNSALLIEKIDDQMTFEIIKSDKPYVATKALNFNKKDFEEHKF